MATEAHRVRPHVNFVYGVERGLYWRLSAEDNLRYFVDLYQLPVKKGRRLASELLELVGLTGREKERVEGFSKGVKQRLHLAKALINHPRILFLDEPSIGLDPVAAREFRALVQSIRSESESTILLTSHYMWEMESLMDRVAVLLNGTIQYLDTAKQLKMTSVGSHVIEITLNDNEDQILVRLSSFGRVVTSTETGRKILQVHTSVPDDVTTTLPTHQFTGVAHTVVRESQLEDAYVVMVEGT